MLTPARLHSAKARNEFERFVRALFLSGGPEVILRHLSDVSVPAPYQIRLKVIYSRSDVSDLLVTRGSFELERFRSESPVFRLRVRPATPHQGSRETVFAVLPTEKPRANVLLSITTSERWKDLLRLVKSKYPRIAPVYLTQRELVEAAKRIASKEGEELEVRVREVSSKERLDVDSRKRIKSVREWTDEDLEEILVQAVERQQTLASLSLSFHKRIAGETSVEPTLLCKLTKESTVSVNGRFDWAWSLLVPYLSALAESKLDFLALRGMRDRNYRAAPVAIKFRVPIFEKVEAVRQLISVLKKYPHGMYSVTHGNPYVHLKVADVLDGSSFEIWALTGDHLVLIPQLQASEAAFSRLLSYIFERFREGEVVEYQ
jgi:hypothetical protein